MVVARTHIPAEAVNRPRQFLFSKLKLRNPGQF
jgi:hypothetical protein